MKKVLSLRPILFLDNHKLLNYKKMKKLAFLVLSLSVLFACNGTQKSNTSNDAEQQEAVEQVVGGDQDEHGCIGSAGETWSELLQACVKVFETGVRLNPVEVEGDDAVISAFAVFNEDKSKVELFLPVESDEAIILDASEEGVYQLEAFKYDSNESALYINDVVVFKAE